MPQFLSDENFEPKIVRGVIRRSHHFTVDRVQDVGLRGAADPTILAWAADHGWVLLTHDRKTMEAPAYERVRNGQRMPGVVIVSDQISIGAAIEQIVLLIECTFEDEWEGRVHHLPL